MADFFVFATPRGELHKIETSGGKFKFEIRWNPELGSELSKEFTKTQEFIDTTVLELCAPMVPKDTNILIESGILCTQIGSGEVKYRTPYARRWYYMPARFQQGSGNGGATIGRGNYWFERMKQKHKKQILAGTKKISGAK